MNQRDKTAEESVEIQSPQREPQGGDSLIIELKNPDKQNNIFIGIGGTGVKCVQQMKISLGDACSIITETCTQAFSRLEHFAIRETPGLVSFPEEAYQDLRQQLDKEIRKNLLAHLQAMEEKSEKKMEMDIAPIKPGRPKITQLLRGFRDSRVCQWFDTVRKKFKNMIDNLKQIMVCFFCALFDVVKTDCYGKGAYFCSMMKTHLHEKIPSTRLFQGAVRWFKDWKRGCPQWANPKSEEQTHKAWQRLYLLIMGELPRLEPQLAIC